MTYIYTRAYEIIFQGSKGEPIFSVKIASQSYGVALSKASAKFAKAHGAGATDQARSVVITRISKTEE